MLEYSQASPVEAKTLLRSVTTNRSQLGAKESVKLDEALLYPTEGLAR
jgi:hypothetical protein